MSTQIDTAQASRPEKPDHPDHGQITIVVDTIDHKVRPGEWLVSNLKATLGIDPSRVLAEITDQGLVDLNDNARIHLREGEQFATHSRSGSSS